jgi:hypothetical protein
VLIDDDLDGFVADVTTIAQSQCEHATDYADVETLICDLPIDLSRSPRMIRSHRTRDRIR